VSCPLSTPARFKVLLNLLMIGASQGTGASLAQLALDKGHRVTTFSRAAARLNLAHPQLNKVNGSFHEAAAVNAVVAGHDAVIITASLTVLQLKRQPTFYATGTRLVIEAMQRHRVPRIVILSNMAAGDGAKLLNLPEKIFTHLFIREATDDHTRQEQLARDSGLQWSVARPSRLTNGPARAQYRVVRGERVPGSIARADVAAFLLDAATTDRWLGNGGISAGN
jgi:putative NADH-flavin reductase